MTNSNTGLRVSVLLLAAICTVAVGENIYVDENATGANNGSSWPDAYNFLQDALADANSAEKPVEIWVAQGAYTPDSNSTLPDGTGKREATFQVINGVSIYGGFPSGGAEFGQRDPNVYETILSGDLHANDVPVNDPCDLLNDPNRTENSNNVVTGSGTDLTAVLDGFSIMGGQESGMRNSKGSPTVENCRFTSNSGSGMFNYESKPILFNCTFNGNWAVWGGGVHNYSSSPIMTSCRFIGNVASDSGGGMYSRVGSNPALVDCTFDGNASISGGGMGISYNSSAQLTSCTFARNSAEYGGGGIHNYDGSAPVLTNCTFNWNTALTGGGMGNYKDSSATLVDCVFRGNSAGGVGGGMDNSSSSPALYNCTFSGNSAEWQAGGMYNYKSSPTLTNCTFSGNSAWDGGGVYNRYSSSPTLTNCILWVNSFPQVSGDATISYSNIEDGFHGEGNINVDPCFVDPGHWEPNGTPNGLNDDFWVDGDYHLKSQAGRWDPIGQTWVLDDVSSPCIDSGDPDTCIGFEPNPNGSVVNMGVYGGTAEASLSPSGISCISADHPYYDEWVQVGEPVCWCYERQCHGDADCKAQGKSKYWVSTNDLDILIAAWSKTFAEIDGQTVSTVPLICADFDHKAQGKQQYRVSTDDLDILIANWNKANAPAADCP
jgi:hypothetical protein